MSNLRRVGREAEDQAAEFLIGLGYTIVTRRYTCAHGELDIVALDGDTLVIVEVKMGRSQGYVPEESLSPKKAKHLSLAAQEYVHAMNEQARPMRFDVVAIDAGGLRHHIGAFED